jgi:photosystem II stability/assembly factor-like uncharacterized protein
MKKIIITIVIIVVDYSTITNAQWFTQNNPFPNSFLNDVFALDENTAIAIGTDYSTNEGIILKTTDGGETWLNKPQDSIDYYSSVYFLNTNTGWIVGGNYLGCFGLLKVLKTTDAGETWIVDTIGTGGVSSVHFADQNKGWAVGSCYFGDYVSRMYKTIDGGLNWALQLHDGIFSSLYFVNKDTGWIAGRANYSSVSILKTLDGGQNWVTQLDTGNIYISSIFFKDEFIGWATGTNYNDTTYPGLIFRTINGGENWVSQLTGVSKQLNGIYFVDENTGWTVGADGIIYGTSNGGINWIMQESGTTNDLHSVQFTNENIGWAVGENGIILRTTNGGGTIPVELTSFNAIAHSGYIELYWSTATETNNMIFEIERRKENSDFVLIGFVEGNGTTTERQEYSYIDRNVTTGKYFYRLKQVDFNGTSEYSNEIEVDAAPVAISLEQNYPNPFNPSTTIRYSIPNSELVTLKIYDVLGNKVATLVSEEKPAGSYEVEFSSHSGFVRNLSSGIYFYTLQAGSYTQTKKLILMK